MFTTILYSADGSTHAAKALTAAIHLAKQNNAKVVVVHAYPGVSDVIGTPEHERLLSTRIAAATRILEDAAGKLEAEGIPVERELLEGPPAEAILKVVETHNCGLVVMGVRGLNDLQGLLLGSVSHRVIQHAACPVLVVR